MKKIAGIVLCLGIAAVAGWFFLLRDRPTAGQYARYLPPEVVGTMNLTHLAAFSDGFAASALGKSLAKETVHTIIRELGGQDKDLVEYDRLYDSVAEVAGDPAFRAVFGDDVTLALLPPDKAGMTRDPAETLRRSLVVVARTAAAGALDVLSRLIKNAKVSRETVDGLELAKITMASNQVVYGYAEGKLLLLAYTPEAIKTCVAAGKGEQALAKAPLYQQAVAFWQPYPEKDVNSRVYLNVEHLAGLLQQAVHPEIKESGELLKGVTSMFSVSYATEQGLESKGRSSYRYDQLHPLMKSAVDAAGANRSLHLLKDRTLVYNWASSLRPEMLVKTLAADDKAYKEMDTEVRRNLGVSLEELSRAFGPQYGGVLDDIVRTPMFPWPKMVLFVELRDRKIAETVLGGIRRLIAGNGMVAEQQEQVEGHTIYSWPVLPGESAQPAVVLTDSMLYLATSKDGLQELLTSKAAVNALAAPVKDVVGTAVAEQLVSANFSSFVIFPQRMAAQTGAALDWLSGILVTTKNISIGRLNAELVQLLQSTEMVAAATHLTKEQADWTMTMRKAAKQPADKVGK